MSSYRVIRFQNLKIDHNLYGNMGGFAETVTNIKFAYISHCTRGRNCKYFMIKIFTMTILLPWKVVYQYSPW